MSSRRAANQSGFSTTGHTRRPSIAFAEDLLPREHRFTGSEIEKPEIGGSEMEKAGNSRFRKARFGNAWRKKGIQKRRFGNAISLNTMEKKTFINAVLCLACYSAVAEPRSAPIITGPTIMNSIGTLGKTQHTHADTLECACSSAGYAHRLFIYWVGSSCCCCRPNIYKPLRHTNTHEHINPPTHRNHNCPTPIPSSLAQRGTTYLGNANGLKHLTTYCYNTVLERD